jgi:pimeloyl-ACP methyl ester carboxylesterase
MTDIVFVHGMFQNPVCWEKWAGVFSAAGYRCHVPAWPLHEGEPAVLRESPPAGLGELTLDEVVARIEAAMAGLERPVMIGHSVGGLVTQIMLARGTIAAGVAVCPVAPNRMVDLDWGFIKNSVTIANPLMGDAPVLMDVATFHGAFANTLDATTAAREFEATATHDSRKVFRGCMGPLGTIDTERAHAPLLLIAGAEDQIIPAHLVEKVRDAWSDEGSVVEYAGYAGRSHYICNEPGWEEVAARALGFVRMACPS